MSNAKVLCIIPARHASVRFPGKPLAELQGKPIIQHVWERVSNVNSLDKTIIATDDQRIFDACNNFGGTVQMTAKEHPSGTDRAWEIAKDLPDYEWVLNVQGDEPLIDPNLIEQLIASIQDWPDADIITALCPIQSINEWRSSNSVKAAFNRDTGRVFYFSRASIPFHRDEFEKPSIYREGFRHIGIYLYKRAALEKFTQLEVSRLERTEHLEQLRALEAGMTFYAVQAEKAPIGVDTPEDLEALKKELAVR